MTDAEKVTREAEPLWQRVLGITLCLLLYAGVIAMVVWMLISYPIEH